MPHRTATALTARLAAISGIRQLHLLDKANGLADEVDRLFARSWRRVLSLLRSRDSFNAAAQSRAVFDALYPDLVRVMAGGFSRLVTWSHGQSARMLSRSLPLDYLQAAIVTPRIPRHTLEDASGDPAGLLQFAIDPLTGLAVTDRTTSLREPAVDKDAARKLFEQLLLPPLPENKIQRLIFQSGWTQRIESLSKLAAPDLLTTTITQGIAQGKTQAEIARLLLPALDGVRASARRVARTVGLDVAHQAQMEAFDGLGDLLAGYQIHAVLDQHTRPAHAARNGTVYWRDPQAGQLGFDVMPQPPKESDGTYAPNCRCHLTPVLRQPAALRDRTPSYATAAGRIVPDPAVYSEWFERAPDRLRRMAVGARRYEHVKQQLGTTPRWADFLHPETGELLHLDTLKQESAFDRIQRRQAVENGIQHRRDLIVTALSRGFVTQEQDQIFNRFNSFTTI